MLPPVDTRSVLALRAQILERSSTLSQVAGNAARVDAPARFDTAMGDALKAVSNIQEKAGGAATAYERGDSHDLASVMIARQKASIAFEATLQVRNRLLGAYKDVMSMPL
ncbi:flagellar hook-basal body complex protein FliE [Polymorphobacter glacialis]|uniref:Flagellar hook-basal body complex protein FliE n=1 Tax=Sandarakinorhabdus glacialis TaxID=1614636 RepID=A0A917ECG7_9SPHN|nr:flagellar hook-basal body complex protein FliE [Polymorphobacter glacialis]GGE20688.1 flagellar hook-basal body complex protein FliE [Polymorphobacter glacialis]